ncbi:hypothetical protein MPTK1_1g09270 [Marchantia polymorpha subsp. ruderalis]|uniref:RAB6-interacting golgin n=2 Tax=Marchantia polymorpha TaxID=3197 RepID=A0AAF6AN78_MARPO|nr:hypothetical protein MARPO_0096s0072 [Marchantia polymorpha]BBM97898.1 hypothetical protein Mp_1g09270 [Marchantia polymorpha subsp. ruderalis]|eukprot:PTQ32730.1 hypothetical protein MARPO_0096s0072 [Marchantia polymorpha]
MGSVPPSFVPNIGADGLATDVPIISYTEKILEEKELKLKQYIQDNYSKIRNVEKELATLALEVKLTAGPKKHALEHLRKMIEASTEKIKAAKLKEEQTKKAWEAAEKAVQAEEAYKQRLCEDLNRLVQESAAAQYTRLEDLTRRLEALNPPPKEASSQESVVDSTTTTPPQQSAVLEAQQPGGSGNEEAVHLEQRTQTKGRTQYVTMGQHISMGRGRGRTTPGGRSKGALVLQGSKSNEAAGWTGAGFNVQEDQ